MLLGQSRTVATGRLSYHVLRTLPDVEAISAEWNSLLDQTQCNRAFSSSKWFLVSCRLNHSLSPHVIVARRRGVLVGVLPLVLINSEVATFASELSDYNDCIALPDDYSVLVGLLDHARSFEDGYKRLVLSRVRLDSNCVRAVQASRPSLDIRKVYQVKGSARYIRLSSSYEEYLGTRSGSFRKSLRRARRGAEDNNLTICELEPGSFPASRLAEVFLSLNLDRWGAESYYQLPFPHSFVLKLLPDLFSERRMRAFALMKDERMLGLELCMMGANSLCGWNGGFLSEAARWSPGNLLIDAGIRRAYAMKLDEYDLLRGDDAYKKSWANSTRHIGWLEFDVNGLTLPNNDPIQIRDSHDCQ